MRALTAKDDEIQTSAKIRSVEIIPKKVWKHKIKDKEINCKINQEKEEKLQEDIQAESLKLIKCKLYE